MSSESRYWKSLPEREQTAAFVRESREEFPALPPELPGDRSRRAFLRAAGFTLAGAAAAGCSRAPVEKALPLLVQPEFLTPGRAYHYASTCGGCAAGCGLLVKCRDGRPIKLEGHPAHPLSRGGLCAVGQASLLELYDSRRLTGPLIDGEAAAWEQVDAVVMAALERARAGGGLVCYLSDSILSPTKRALIARFLSGFPNRRHVIYDPLSAAAILAAHERTHGVRVLPHYRLERAEMLLGLEADFLGTWIAPVEFTAAYSAARNLEAETPRLSYHVQLEARLSLTGSKADVRHALPPGALGAVLNHLLLRIAGQAGAALGWSDPGAAPLPAAVLDELAARLWESRGRSLVLCGEEDTATQTLANALNHLLGNYGHTLELAAPSYQRQGSDADLQALWREVAAGQVAALLVDGVDPLADLPDGARLAEHLRQVPLRISFRDHLDETARAAQYVCPDLHYLEAWGDAEPVSGVVSLAQPCMAPLGNRRAVLETLAAWSGPPQSAYEQIRGHWEQQIFPRGSGENRENRSFGEFWDRCLHDGFAVVEAESPVVQTFQLAALEPVPPWQPPGEGELALVLYPKVGLLDGRHAGNPWLQELPDPISKVTWDNYACLAPATAARLGLAEEEVVRLEARAADGRVQALELPVFLQPGQQQQTVAVALGYGRRETERFAGIGPPWLEARPTVGADGRVGKNAAPLLEWQEGTLRRSGRAVRLTPTGRRQRLASTQSHHTLTVPEHLRLPDMPSRPIIQETTWAAWQQDPQAGAVGHGLPEADLWPRDHPFLGHRWGMVIDLGACTGCSACVIACQAENNVPVVGKDEVARKRAMHWLRLDRYYSEPEGRLEVAHQPMLCQHCEHAPCETVCPVLATVHSEEGLNQQIYNRCVGTRYCANNCPYKVRRFNWFDYPRRDPLASLVLNPDVTVRSRGVMEKCTFCVQRIQDGKAEAQRQGRPLADGAIQTACQQSCPAQAIVFGDVNDPASRVSRLARSGRHYRVLEELNVRPAVGYLRIVRNRPQPAPQEGDHHAHG